MASTEECQQSSCSISYSNLPEITMVDLPFFASSTEAAYSTLGGKEMTMALIRDGVKSLSLKFPSSNALQGSLVGERMNTGGGLLLKIRRKKEKLSSDLLDTPSQQKVLIEVLGRVDSAYVFTQPADYQVLPSLRRQLCLDASVLSSKYFGNCFYKQWC